MPYLDSLIVAYRHALSADHALPISDARTLLTKATSAHERGQALAAIALALVHEPVMPTEILPPLDIGRRPGDSPAYETDVTRCG